MSEGNAFGGGPDITTRCEIEVGQSFRSPPRAVCRAGCWPLRERKLSVVSYISGSIERVYTHAPTIPMLYKENAIGFSNFESAASSARRSKF